MKGKWQSVVSVLLVVLLLGSTLTPFQVSAENTGTPLETIKYTSIDVTTEPEKLIAGQDFKVIVTGTYDVYDEKDNLKQSSLKKQLEGVDVEFNQQTYTTNTEGIIEIAGEKAQFGEYELELLKSENNSYLDLLPKSKNIIVEEEPDETVATVNVRVEGSSKTILDIKDFEVTGKESVSVFEATLQALEANDVVYEKADSGFGPYMESIDGDKSSQFNKWDGWLYTLNESSLDEGAGSVTVKDGDTIVWYYGNTNSLYENNDAAGSVEDLTLRPIITVNGELVAGKEIQVQISAEYNSYDSSYQLMESGVIANIENATVLYNGKEYRTNADGMAIIPAEDVVAGEFELKVTKDVEGSYPRLLRSIKSITIGEQEKETTVAKVNVRVEGSAETLLNIKDFEVTGKGSATVLDATIQALEAYNLDYKLASTNDYVLSIAGEQQSQFKAIDGWQITVNDSYLQLNSDQFTVADGDTIVWYYGNISGVVEDYTKEKDGFDYKLGAGSVEEITLRPIIAIEDGLVAGKEIQIHISAKYSISTSGFQLKESNLTANIKDASIFYNGKVYKTDENGIATIPAEDVVAGEFELKVTKDVENSFPRLLRSYKTIKIGEPTSIVDYKAETAKAVTKTIDYYKNAGLKANTSYSDYWTLSGLWAAGVDLSTFSWAENGSPFTVDTFWQKGLSKANNASNADAGAIIGSVLLGKDPTAFGTQNLAEDLKEKQKESGAFSTIWGEPWAMIALDLIGETYNQEKHIQVMLAAQNKETGYFGDADSTGWVLWALSAHKENEAVKAAIEKAVEGIHNKFQNSQGEIVKNNSNSNAALISGLAAVGEDLFSKKWTIETENGPVNIVKYFIDAYQLADGGFKWQAANTKANAMATQQSLLAIADAVQGNSVFERLKNTLATPEPKPDEGGTGDNTGNEEDNPSTGNGSSDESGSGSSTSDVSLINGTRDVTKSLTLTPTGSSDLVYGPETGTITIKGNVTIKGTANEKISLRNIIIDGVLTVDTPNASVVVESTTKVEGKTTIINVANQTFTNNGELGEVELTDADGTRFINGKGASIGILTIKTPGNVILGGTLPNTVVEQAINLVIEDGATITNLEVNAPVTIDLPSTAKIETLKVEGTVTLNGEGKVTSITGSEANKVAGDNATIKDAVDKGKESTSTGGGSSSGGSSSGGSTGGENTTNPTKETVKISIVVSSTEMPLAPTDIAFKKNDTAFDVLKRAAEKNDIELNYRNTSYGIYVAGIAGVNEFDHGPLSGWTYKVNGELPEVSADNYQTKAGDTIEWIYTAGSENEDSSSGGSGGSGGSSNGDSTTQPEENTNTDEATKPEENTGDGETVKPEENEGNNGTVTPVSFKDVPNNWSKAYIEKAVELNLFKGYKDGTFRPQEQLTRAQAAAVVVRALNLSTTEQAPFEDIKNLGEVTQAEIAAAYKYGIVLGQLDGSFNPSTKVTRAQLALMLSRAYAHKAGKVYEAKAIAPFNDYGNANEATVNAISTLYELGIASGSNGSYMLHDSTTRAQAARMFVNFLEITSENKK